MTEMESVVKNELLEGNLELLGNGSLLSNRDVDSDGDITHNARLKIKRNDDVETVQRMSSEKGWMCKKKYNLEEAPRVQSVG